MDLTNTALLKSNGEYEDAIAKTDTAIMSLIRRIDVSTLLKEIDIDEMRILAKNNIDMQNAFQGMLSKWNLIKSKEDGL